MKKGTKLSIANHDSFCIQDSFLTLYEESVKKQMDEFHKKVEEAIVSIFREYVTPPIKGEITKTKLRWRGVKEFVYSTLSPTSGVTFVGVKQRDTLIFPDGIKMNYSEYVKNCKK